MRTPYPRFRSEGSFLLVALGVCLGTGSLWRFPRLLAQEGSVFLIPWGLSLAAWSYPLLLAELAIGKRTGLALPGAFARLLSGRAAWVGTLLATAAYGLLTTVAVACGWCLAYCLRAWTRDLFADPQAANTAYHLLRWTNFSESWGAVPYMAIALAVASFIVARGVHRGLEWGHLVLVPGIMAVLFLLAVRALADPGAGAALGRALVFRPGALSEPSLWLAGLQQALWSTAAGFGWLATYSGSAPAAARPRRVAVRVVVVSAIASLLMALAVLPLAFGRGSPPNAAAHLLGSEISFSFVWMPTMLANSAGGALLGPLYYSALAVATLLTLVALLETVTRVAVDLGAERAIAAPALAATAAVLALPGALRRDVLDFERWSLELLLVAGSGLIALQVTRYGFARLAREVIRPGEERVAPFVSLALSTWIPVGAAALVTRNLWLAATTGGSPIRLMASIALALVLVVVARSVSPDLVRGTFTRDLESRPRDD